MLEAYREHVAERAEQGIVPKPLSAEQVAGLVELLKAPPAGEEEFILELLTNRVPAGVDEAAYVKAAFLSAVAKGEAESPLIDKLLAVKLLGTMLGGYNIATLVDLLDTTELGAAAADELSHTLLVFDAFYDVAEKAKSGNENAKRVMQSWADAEWLPVSPSYQTGSRPSCSRCPERPTPTTSPPLRMHGPVPTFPCTRRRCTRIRARVSPMLENRSGNWNSPVTPLR